MKIQGKRIMSKKRKITLIILSIIATLGLAVIIVPPMISINFLKPKIENVILSETGINAKIHGNINFGLIGKTTIIAHNISVPNGVISSIEFSVPFFDIFNINKANINGDIFVNGASVAVEKIVPFDTNKKITITNSKFKFLNKEYDIIRADLSKNTVDAFVRTDQHKYEIKSIDNHFVIKNKNNDLILNGELFDNGTARARISITAQNVNRWFEFQKPRISGQFPITADLIWDGQYGIKFSNISADGVYGDIELKNDGYKIINLQSDNADYDMSFFAQAPDVLQNASFNLNFHGNMTFLNQKMKKLVMSITGYDKELKINKITTDYLDITGGTIDGNGAHNLNMLVIENNIPTKCIFNGTATDWWCETFSYGDIIHGKLGVTQDNFYADIYSNETTPDIESIVSSVRKLGTQGTVNFEFPDMTGTLKITKKAYSVSYKTLKNKSLNWVKFDLSLLPEFMKNENGDFVYTDKSMVFVPHSKQWQLSTHNDHFVLRGDNFKMFFPNIDFDCLRDLPFIISGNYKNDNISDLKIEIANQEFIGSLSNNLVTLRTEILNLDNFTNDDFIDNFESLSFFVPHPLTIPFDTGLNIAIGAKDLIYNKQTYNNFVYSLHDNTQTFSITDSNRGNILTNINKDNTKYTINIQLNKFVFDDKILPDNMPLNISDTAITAEIKLTTSGKIAHDIINNIRGTFDASLNGGKLYGFGFNNFYASAPTITILNGEKALYNALNGGITPLKKIHIIGTYDNGNIKTTKPFTMTMPHINSSGNIEIQNGEMTAQMQLVLRGTSANPAPIDLIIYPNDYREYSLSEIMLHFDPEYMRAFVKSHDQF